jgi:mono/diheme cytochrome c family protein
MWNHAPHMYEAINSAGLPYPAMTYDEAGQLVGYLYLVGFADEPGNAELGRRAFSEKGCIRCHSADGGKNGAPSIEQLARADNPIAWTQALWNHASGMERSMSHAGVSWPSFNDNQLRDLFAYVSATAGRTGQSFTVPIGDAARGWQIYQSKSCLQCHALKERGGPTAANTNRPMGPELGSATSLPPTLSQFGQTMLNHFPAMHRAIGTKDGTAPPTFAAQEMADLTMFLYSLHYVEPAGSPHIGETAFAWRGCADCHGVQAQGTRRGPALRGRGQNYTSVRMAASLWAHGVNMYEQTRQRGQGWPLLQESDIGDLLAFLNTPLDSSTPQH